VIPPDHLQPVNPDSCRVPLYDTLGFAVRSIRILVVLLPALRLWQFHEKVECLGDKEGERDRRGRSVDIPAVLLRCGYR